MGSLAAALPGMTLPIIHGGTHDYASGDDR